MAKKRKRSADRDTTASPSAKGSGQLFDAWSKCDPAEERMFDEIRSYEHSLEAAVMIWKTPVEIWSNVCIYMTGEDKSSLWDAMVSLERLVNPPKGFAGLPENRKKTKITKLLSDLKEQMKLLSNLKEQKKKLPIQAVCKDLPVKQKSYPPAKYDYITRATMSANNAHGVAWQSDRYKISLLSPNGAIKKFTNGPKYVKALALSSKHLVGLGYHVVDLPRQPQHIEGLDAKGETILLHTNGESEDTSGQWVTKAYVWTYQIRSRALEHFAEESPQTDTRFVLDHDGRSVMRFKRLHDHCTFAKYNLLGHRQRVHHGAQVVQHYWTWGEDGIGLKMEMIDRKIVVAEKMKRCGERYDDTTWSMQQLLFNSETENFHVANYVFNDLRQWASPYVDNDLGPDPGFSNVLSPRSEGDCFYVLSRLLGGREDENEEPKVALNLLYPALHPLSIETTYDCRSSESGLQSINEDTLNCVDLSANETHIFIFHHEGILTLVKPPKSDSWLLRSGKRYSPTTAHGKEKRLRIRK